jgi:hypothetical protein
MSADRSSLPAYARRGVLLDPNRELKEALLKPSHLIRRTFFQILREDFLPPFPGRKKRRKRRQRQGE